MVNFMQRHEGRVVGVLSGFDRVLFRGTLRSISYVGGLDIFLSRHGVLYKDFKSFVQRISDRLKSHAESLSSELGRPFEYLASSSVSKEEVARQIMDRDGIDEGLICMFSCVEPCQSYSLRGNKVSKRLEIRAEERKCLHLYFYYVDREFGLMHVRLQSWLPMSIQICINGRHYLEKRLQANGIGYEKRDNCFTHIDDIGKAQALLDELRTYDWVPFLKAFARRHNPWIGAESGLDLHPYYWTIRQGEYATDVMFGDEAALNEIYPALIRHAMQHFDCKDVLRFLGRRTNKRFSGQVTSDIKSRPEGVRIKHRVEENSIKMYNKQGNILRVETTINNPRRFKIYRKVTRKGHSVYDWVRMRKGVADIARRIEVSLAANERYLQALAVVGVSTPTYRILDPVCRRIIRRKRPFRALQPLQPAECTLFGIMMQPEHLLQGFRNRDIRHRLFPDSSKNQSLKRKVAARITRYFRLLRAHGLIRKIPKTHYYRITRKGYQLMTTVLNLRNYDVAKFAIQ